MYRNFQTIYLNPFTTYLKLVVMLSLLFLSVELALYSPFQVLLMSSYLYPRVRMMHLLASSQCHYFHLLCKIKNEQTVIVRRQTISN